MWRRIPTANAPLLLLQCIIFQMSSWKLTKIIVICSPVSMLLCCYTFQNGRYYQSVLFQENKWVIERRDMNRPVFMYTLSMCREGGSLSLKPTEQIGWRFIRNDIVNEKASPLPIHHRWCIANKLLGSKKLLLRGWPPWWKQQLPHGHPRIHCLLFSIQQQSLSLYEGTHINTTCWGVVCVHWPKTRKTHNLSPDTGRKAPTPQHQRSKVKSEGYCHTVQLECVFTTLHLIYSTLMVINRLLLSLHFVFWCKCLTTVSLRKSVPSRFVFQCEVNRHFQPTRCDSSFKSCTRHDPQQ